MTPRAARGIRRAMLVGSGGIATLLAHGAAMGHSTVTTGSLGALVALSALAAMSAALRPRPVFRQRGLPALLLGQLVIQGLLHLAMSRAPWAFGLAPHPVSGAIDEAALLPHLIAGVVLALLCLGVDEILAGALGAITFLRRLIVTVPGGRGVSGWHRVPIVLATTAEALRANPGAARAPPPLTH